ncbi:MAG TPA: hypothetical protein PKD91_14375 [Bacteroidia bacterium]|nr:hypothetical protein [Bacteroidia bacterium]
MNTLRILEISWLILGIVGIGLGVYNFFTDGLVAAVWPLLFTFIAGIFYFVRRKQRIAYEKYNKQTFPEQEQNN